MIYTPKVIAKIQNLIIECDGNDSKFHCDIHEYDYIVSGLNNIKTILKECMNSPKYQSEHISGIVLKKGLFLICYLNKDRQNNPYLFIYDKNKDKVRNISYIDELSLIFKNDKVRENIPYKITDTIFLKDVFTVCQE